MRAFRRKPVQRVLIFLAVALGLYLGLIWFGQRWLLYPSWIVRDPGTSLVLPPHERLVMTSDQGPIEALLMLGRGVSAEAAGPLVIVAHGNGEWAEHRALEMGRYVRSGISVLLPEYRGYGRSAGRPTQARLTRDFVAWRDRIAERPEVDADRIAYHGRSLGGGVVGQLTAKRPPAALVLESTFTRIADHPAAKLGPPFMIRDPYDTLAVVRDLDLPILVLRSPRDEVIPGTHGERLAAAAQDATLVTFDGGHNDPLPPSAWDAILDYMRHMGMLGEATADEADDADLHAGPGGTEAD